jgi:endonuclease YncB( thermonuclease family)
VQVDGQIINLLMVQQGMAWVYDFFCSDEIYYKAENEAKNNYAGLWQQQKPTPPWIFRRTQKIK